MTPATFQPEIEAAADNRPTGALGLLRSVVAGLVYGGAAFSAGFGIGVLRELFLAPRITTELAIVVETPLMMWISFLVARAVARWLKAPATSVARLAMGATGLGLLLWAENALSWAWQGRSVFEQWALYGYLAAGATFVGLLWFCVAPALAARRR